ncbi:MAG: Lrp/AsnC family transcriptional regulator [Promethearchaeota archaeon]|jgi:Lrp/AsnC family transcriptional regulator for asnA, asnC and gidA
MGKDLDKIDKQILNNLQKDGRKSFAEIARELDVNEATIRFRVKKLLDKEVIIRFSALLNPRKIGLAVTGIIMATVDPRKSKDTFKELANLYELLHIFQCTGKYDFIAVANVENMEKLERLKTQIKTIEGIKNLEILATTRLLKIEPSFKL